MFASRRGFASQSPVPQDPPLQCLLLAATLTAEVIPSPQRRRCRAISRRVRPTQRIWSTWIRFYLSRVDRLSLMVLT